MNREIKTHRISNLMRKKRKYISKGYFLRKILSVNITNYGNLILARSLFRRRRQLTMYKRVLIITQLIKKQKYEKLV